MVKKLILDPILACLAQILTPRIFWQVLPLQVVSNCSKLSTYAIQMKTKESNLKKWQKTELGLDFGSFGQNLGLKIFLCGFYLYQILHSCKLLLYVISRKTNLLNLRKQQEKNILGLILAHLTQIWAQKTFFVGFTCTKCQTLLQAITVWTFKDN